MQKHIHENTPSIFGMYVFCSSFNFLAIFGALGTVDSLRISEVGENDSTVQKSDNTYMKDFDIKYEIINPTYKDAISWAKTAAFPNAKSHCPAIVDKEYQSPLAPVKQSLVHIKNVYNEFQDSEEKLNSLKNKFFDFFKLLPHDDEIVRIGRDLPNLQYDCYNAVRSILSDVLKSNSQFNVKAKLDERLSPLLQKLEHELKVLNDPNIISPLDTIEAEISLLNEFFFLDSNVDLLPHFETLAVEEINEKKAIVIQWLATIHKDYNSRRNTVLNLRKTIKSTQNFILFTTGEPSDYIDPSAPIASGISKKDISNSSSDKSVDLKVKDKVPTEENEFRIFPGNPEYGIVLKDVVKERIQVSRHIEKSRRNLLSAIAGGNPESNLIATESVIRKKLMDISRTAQTRLDKAFLNVWTIEQSEVLPEDSLPRSKFVNEKPYGDAIKNAVARFDSNFFQNPVNDKVLIAGIPRSEFPKRSPNVNHFVVMPHPIAEGLLLDRRSMPYPRPSSDVENFPEFLDFQFGYSHLLNGFTDKEHHVISIFEFHYNSLIKFGQSVNQFMPDDRLLREKFPINMEELKNSYSKLNSAQIILENAQNMNADMSTAAKCDTTIPETLSFDRPYPLQIGSGICPELADVLLKESCDSENNSFLSSDIDCKTYLVRHLKTQSKNFLQFKENKENEELEKKERAAKNSAELKDLESKKSPSDDKKNDNADNVKVASSNKEGNSGKAVNKKSSSAFLALSSSVDEHGKDDVKSSKNKKDGENVTNDAKKFSSKEISKIENPKSGDTTPPSDTITKDSTSYVFEPIFNNSHQYRNSYLESILSKSKQAIRSENALIELFLCVSRSRQSDIIHGISPGDSSGNRDLEESLKAHQLRVLSPKDIPLICDTTEVTSFTDPGLEPSAMAREANGLRRKVKETLEIIIASLAEREEFDQSCRFNKVALLAEMTPDEVPESNKKTGKSTSLNNMVISAPKSTDDDEDDDDGEIISTPGPLSVIKSSILSSNNQIDLTKRRAQKNNTGAGKEYEKLDNLMHRLLKMFQEPVVIEEKRNSNLIDKTVGTATLDGLFSEPNSEKGIANLIGFDQIEKRIGQCKSNSNTYLQSIESIESDRKLICSKQQTCMEVHSARLTELNSFMSDRLNRINSVKTKLQLITELLDKKSKEFQDSKIKIKSNLQDKLPSETDLSMAYACFAHLLVEDVLDSSGSSDAKPSESKGKSTDESKQNAELAKFLQILEINADGKEKNDNNPTLDQSSPKTQALAEYQKKTLDKLKAREKNFPSKGNPNLTEDEVKSLVSDVLASAKKNDICPPLAGNTMESVLKTLEEIQLLDAEKKKEEDKLKDSALKKSTSPVFIGIGDSESGKTCEIGSLSLKFFDVSTILKPTVHEFSREALNVESTIKVPFETSYNDVLSELGKQLKSVSLKTSKKSHVKKRTEPVEINDDGSVPEIDNFIHDKDAELVMSSFDEEINEAVAKIRNSHTRAASVLMVAAPTAWIQGRESAKKRQEYMSAEEQKLRKELELEVFNALNDFEKSLNQATSSLKASYQKVKKISILTENSIAHNQTHLGNYQKSVENHIIAANALSDEVKNICSMKASIDANAGLISSIQSKISQKRF